MLSSICSSFICLVNRLPIWNYLPGFHYFTYTSMGNFWRGAVLLDLQSMEFMLIPGYELYALCCTWSCHLWIFRSQIFSCLFRSLLVCSSQLPSKASMIEEIKSLNFVCFALLEWNNWHLIFELSKSLFITKRSIRMSRIMLFFMHRQTCSVVHLTCCTVLHWLRPCPSSENKKGIIKHLQFFSSLVFASTSRFLVYPFLAQPV